MLRSCLENVGRCSFRNKVPDEPRMATATAKQDTTLYVVPQEVFKNWLSWLAEEDRLISHVITTLVSRLRGQFIG